ncbi:MAG TPA: hypothetical protein VHB98_02615 [Chloroflexota bacterium]|jgi:hypothetical protein|nr:hypothetical protein [Chloroflexota bacterium]
MSAAREDMADTARWQTAARDVEAHLRMARVSTLRALGQIDGRGATLAMLQTAAERLTTCAERGSLIPEAADLLRATDVRETPAHQALEAAGVCLARAEAQLVTLTRMLSPAPSRMAQTRAGRDRGRPRRNEVGR